MKVLLDENMPHRLRRSLEPHEVFTTQYMGWSGLKNGRLLAAAEEAQFDVLVTGDQTLTSEQKVKGRLLGFVVLSSIEYEILEPYLADIRTALEGAQPGKVIFVPCGLFHRGLDV